MESKDLSKKLADYGKVKSCRLVNDVAIIVVTDGFSENAKKTFSFIKDCQDCFPEHQIIKTCITETNFAMVVLGRS